MRSHCDNLTQRSFLFSTTESVRMTTANQHCDL